MSESRCDLAIVLHDLRGGGAERAMLRLTRGFVEAGLKVALVLIRHEGAYSGDIPPGVDLHVLNGKSVLASVPQIGRIIRDLKPTAVLAALTHVNIAVVLAKLTYFRQIPTFLSERNQISEKRATARGVRGKLTFALVPALYRRAQGIVAVSDGVAADVREVARLGTDRVHYVHNPVFDNTILDRAKEPAPHRWLEDGGSPVIIAVGRLHMQKDFATLCKAFFRFRESSAARLIIFGEGPERAALQALVDASPYAESVDLAGFCGNPFAAMARADLMVLSSRWEGFPNVLVEAMSCGCPVVATDCPSGPMEILEGGAYGPLVPVGDAVAMAAAMAATIGSADAKERVRARAKVFSIENAVKGYRAVIGV